MKRQPARHQPARAARRLTTRAYLTVITSVFERSTADSGAAPAGALGAALFPSWYTAVTRYVPAWLKSKYRLRSRWVELSHIWSQRR